MKKYVVLAVATCLAIVAVIGCGAMVKKPPVEVSAVELQPRTVEQTVTCSGKVEAADNQNVVLEIPCVAGQVYVEPGQRVEKGDVLFSVDVEATKAVMIQAGGLGVSQIPDSAILTEVIAPVSGILSALNVAEGEIAPAQKPCAVIAGGDALQVAVTIREQDLQKIALGQRVTIKGAGFREESYTGILTQISASARQQYVGSAAETVVDAVVAFDTGCIDDSLRVGLNAKALVTVAETPEALVVPYECVLQDEEGVEYVYICQEDGDKTRAVRRNILSGEEWSAGFHVVSGLRPGDRVVSDPQAVSGDGAVVSIRGGDGA
jgi:multidrug efflux pump subunit AcrA (membrane-fusion protein)